MKGAWRSRLYSRQLVVGRRRRPAEDSARFAFAAARGVPFRFRLGTVGDPNPPNQEATSVVRRCGTGAVLKTGIFTVCASVLGVENY